MLHPSILATSFVVIFLAELPDKSLFASLVLGLRHRALWVWLGVSAAFVVHVVIAVLAGGLISLLPRLLVHAVVTVLFAVGALVLLRPPVERTGERERPVRTPRPLAVVAASFGVVFAAEWGDVTQLAVANLAARYGDPLSVGVGSSLGLMAAAGLAVLGGSRLLARVPILLVRRVAGVVLLLFAALSAVSLLA